MNGVGSLEDHKVFFLLSCPWACPVILWEYVLVVATLADLIKVVKVISMWIRCELATLSTL